MTYEYIVFATPFSLVSLSADGVTNVNETPLLRSIDKTEEYLSLVEISNKVGKSYK